MLPLQAQVAAAMAGFMKASPVYQSYAAVAGSREHMSQNRLAIPPDLMHYEIFLAPALVTTALPFLDGQSGSKTWAEQVKHD